MGGYVKWIISILVILILVTFGVENSQSVQIKYYLETFTFNLPQYAIVYASVIIGILIGIGIGFRSRHRLQKRLRKLERENRDLKESATDIVMEEETEEDNP